MRKSMYDEQASGEKALGGALAYVRSIVDTVREPLLVLDARLRVQSANQSFYRTFQVSPQETEGRLLYDLGNGQWEIPSLHILLGEILPQNTFFDDFEVQHDFPDIGQKVMLLNARRLQHEDAELILLAIEDITERRRLEAERAEIENRFTALVKNIKDHSIFTLDPAGRVTSWNIAAEQILGYSEAAVLGRHFSFIFTPEDQAQGVPEAELDAARAHGRAEDERWHLRKGGERFWALGIVSALHDADGRLTGFSKILRDMTAWKHAEQALHESHHRLQAILESIPAAVVLIDAATSRLSYLNPRALELYGRDYVGVDLDAHLEAIAAQRLDGTSIPSDELPIMYSLRHGEAVFGEEMLIHRADGSVVPVAVSSALLYDRHGQVDAAVVVFDDISTRLLAEEATMAAEEVARQRLAELEDLYHNAPVGLCLLDRDLRYLRINQRLADINGIPAGEHIGRTVRELMPALADTLEPSMREVVATGEPRLDVEIVSETPSRPGVQRSFTEQWLPVKDAHGQVTGVSIVAEESTERKQAEAAVQEANRRKDVFLATLAHELRNPLAPMRTGLDLLQSLRGDATEAERAIQMMDRQLTHLVRLVDDLLDVSRISRGKIQLQKERLDLSEIIEAAMDMSRSGLNRDDRHVTLSVPEEPLRVVGDRVRLVQIVANLLNNAAKFTNPGGHIALRVVRQGDQIEIRVQDDGRGIAREQLGDIFEMFAQAEPGRGGGLGIGLTLVRSLVEMHGGSVRADSDGLGHGTTFTVSLPLCRSTQEQPMQDEATENTLLAPECRVLVVDDNEDIAESLRMLLNLLNAEVRVACGGAEAVELCKEWQRSHVLMDLGMPGMDGYEAARRLRAEHPDDDFRLIALTGWGHDDVRHQTRDAGFDQHLVKPVGVAELKAALSSS
ncbi:PAS domain S-box protein [Thiohalocapsa sp.]|uniref:PAS domain S-box protein n=1 Tax=Thiohalocapsa sp. TaxID=2497641 RepID=UPI0025E38015|nr:PAS domain S-box protein [Thiohalocapsa sp.]